jgi:hypothetical protein
VKWIILRHRSIYGYFSGLEGPLWVKLRITPAEHFSPEVALGCKLAVMT